MEQEEWRDAVGYEGHYEVSNCGHVRRSVNNPYRQSTKPGRMLATDRPDPSTGYARVTLHVSGRSCREQVHRLVAKAFLHGPIEGRHVNHIDGNKMNNAVANLEWVTHRENIRHAWRLGLASASRGEDHYKAKLRESDIQVIRDASARGIEGRTIAAVFNVTESNVSCIVRMKAWRNVQPEGTIQTETA